MKTLLALIGAAALIVVIGVSLYIGTGAYNVAATVPHWSLTYEIIEEARDQSISFHSKGTKVPQLNDAAMVAKGASDFHQTCRLCHGAPGYPREDFAMGLYPSPPDLSSEDLQKELKEPEMFWIVKNGLKMTGMPAFGYTHSDDDILRILALVRKLPKLSPEEYNAIAGAATSRSQEHQESTNQGS